MDSREITARACAALVGAVLALAGAGKVISWNQWRANARQQHLWTIVAVALPPLELVLGASLLVLKPAATVLGLATLLLVVFTSFLALQVTMKSQVPCACFGAHVNRPPSWRDVIRNLAAKGMTILLVEQNARLALQMADRAYVMESGLITFSGTGKELLQDPRVRTAYLGE